MDSQALRARLRIPRSHLDQVNELLLNPDNQVVSALLDVVARYGTPEEINRKAREARRLSNLMGRLRTMKSPYVKDLRWLIARRDAHEFVPMPEYRRQVSSDRAGTLPFCPETAVTLEVSALQYFPWLIAEARQALEKRELMPGRYIRVRKMKESESDQGDLMAVIAAMQIIGASYVETLDTKGTDGANVHLGGPDTILGYFGGIGQPNDYPLRWLDEYLYYYTNYGVRQVLNINSGTILLAYLLHKLGVDNEFKISVFVGNDNPYAVLWTLLAARLLSRRDGSSPLIGFNLSNSVNNHTIELAARVRRELGFDESVRLEHHITETWKSIVRQPYNRRQELVAVAASVPNISAKHEGGDPEVEQTRAHPSDALDYFIAKTDVEAQGLMPALLRNYLDKHDALNATARALTARGIAVVAAKRLHGADQA